MNRRSYTLVSWVLLSIFLLGGIVTMPQTFCSPTSETVSLIGYACTAEQIQAPNIWTLHEHTAIVPSKELLHLVTAFLFIVLTHLFLSIKRPTRGLTFLHRREGPIRSGPSPQGTFLPNLYATHGF